MHAGWEDWLGSRSVTQDGEECLGRQFDLHSLSQLWALRHPETDGCRFKGSRAVRASFYQRVLSAIFEVTHLKFQDPALSGRCGHGPSESELFGANEE